MGPASRICIVALLGAALVAGTTGCDLFLGDNWGWEGYPCDADRHCQKGLSCFWAVANPACVTDATWIGCNTDDDCHQALDDRFKCNQEDYFGGMCDTEEAVIWCFEDENICDELGGDFTCTVGICVKSGPDAFGQECSDGASICTQAGLECIGFERPGVGLSERCSEECANNQFCKDNHPGTVCTWVGNRLACADPAWTDRYLAACDGDQDCTTEPHNSCTEVTGSDTAMCAEPCATVGDCDAGQTCCVGAQDRPTHCLPADLCFPTCVPPCSEWERCKPQDQQCEPVFPFVIDAGGIGLTKTVAISLQGDGSIFVAYGGVTVGTEGPRFRRFIPDSKTLDPAVEHIGQFESIDSLDFNPVAEDRSRLAIIGRKAVQNVEMEVRDLSTGNLIGAGPENMDRLVYTPSGADLITVENQAANVVVGKHHPLDASRQRSVTVGDATDLIHDLAVSLDSALAAVGTGLVGFEGNVHLVELAGDMTVLTPIYFDTRQVDALTFTQNTAGDSCIVVAAENAGGTNMELWCDNLDGTWGNAATDLFIAGGDDPILALGSVRPPGFPGDQTLVFGLAKGGDNLYVWIVRDVFMEHLATIPAHTFDIVDTASIDFTHDGEWMATTGNGEVWLWNLTYLIKEQIGFGYPCTVDADCQASDVFRECLENMTGAGKSCNHSCAANEECGQGYCCQSGASTCVTQLIGPCQ